MATITKPGVKLVTDYTRLLARTPAAFDEALAETVADAQQRAPKRTGAFARSITSKKITAPANAEAAVVGSPLSSARVKEKGGYMQARKHDTLFIPQADGSVRRPVAVRVRAQPTVAPAASNPAWSRRMTARLKAKVGR